MTHLNNKYHKNSCFFIFSVNFHHENSQNGHVKVSKYILSFVLGKSSGNPNLAVVSKNMSVPTVTIVTKPQVPSVVPRPSFRISTGILYYVKGWFLLYR
jgi:hypothetical protein